MYTFQSIIKVSLYWWHYSSVFYISLHLSLSAQFKFTVCSNSVTTIPQGGNAVLCMGWFMNRKLQLGNKNKQVFLHLFQQLQKSCTIRSNVKMLKLTWFSWKHSSVSSICGVCVFVLIWLRWDKKLAVRWSHNWANFQSAGCSCSQVSACIIWLTTISVYN